MMNESLLRKRRLFALGLVCAVFLLPATLVWLVNLEQALRVLNPGWRFLEPLLPSALYAFCGRFTADLSTVSTLVVVLILFFPLVMARRVLRYAEQDPARLNRLVYDPYPPHFPFFLVMLGLVGTLYGLLLGLDVSGVSTLGAGVSSPETIQQTLDQLLDGTATALLSSLWGLVGAFVAARPLTWLFHRAACLPKEDERVSLTETLHQVTGDLQALGEASRAFGERLNRTRIEDVPGVLGEIQTGLKGVEQILRAQQEQAERTFALLSGLADLQREQLEAFTRADTAAGEDRRRAEAQRDHMLEHLAGGARDRATDRAALREAFRHFIESGAGDPPADLS